MKESSAKSPKAKKSKARFHMPRNVLREKVGTGGISQIALQRGEELIDNNDLDFAPYAMNYIERLDALVDEVRGGPDRGKQAIERITQPIMEIKANGGMFKYRLLSEVADILLDFLENLEELDEDSLDVIAVHQSALRVIINNKLSGHGGAAGRALAEELYNATKRYYAKHV